MKLDGERLCLSASDLANHVGCRHLTRLNKAVAEGRRKKPDYFDPALKTLQERGFAHEARYLDHLRAQGLSVVELSKEPTVEASLQSTIEAMRRGVDVIAQATMTSGRWLGYADVLRRVNVPSLLGSWSYEAQDTKLSRETKVGAVLQLSLYSHILEQLQGSAPEYMTVVSPGTPFNHDRLRVDDFSAYYRWARSQLEHSIQSQNPEDKVLPEPVSRCESCNWIRDCEKALRSVDHLSFVAGITKTQRGELEKRNIVTLAGLAALGIPVTWKPQRGSAESLIRSREQARLQLEGRASGLPKYELLEPLPERGLALLPLPSPGDIFFDFEGDPFVDGGGLEYLFGYAQSCEPTTDYRALWALTRTEEKRAFETFVDDVMGRWARDPNMHVYHFAPYEPAAMRRLMGRHGTREQQVDQMLRGGLFVDLFTIVRQSLRASVESYSIKRLEPFFGYSRDVPLPDVGPSKRALEAALELPSDSGPEIDDSWRKTVEAYNRDDCLSAMALRSWLESLRADVISKGHNISRPTRKDAEPSAALKESEQRSKDLRDRLLCDVPENRHLRSNPENARALMASLIDFHRREDKVIWWERYRLKDLPEDELQDEPRAIFDLTFIDRVGGKKVPIHRYKYPSQIVDAEEGANVYRPDAPDSEWELGTLVALDRDACTVDIKKTGKTADIHPSAIYIHKYIRPDPLPDALFRLGTWIAANGLDSPGAFRAGRDLLLRHAPRLLPTGQGIAKTPEETPLAQAIRLGFELDGGVLPIQGPPGAGKTFTGARMIVALAGAGKRVGVTAMSHKVLRNLLDEVVEAAAEMGVKVRCGQKVSDKPDPASIVQEFKENEDALGALVSRDIQVLGGTPWLWAREDASSSVDVLFIDEAGQLSIANAVAVSGAAANLVLLGDPRQLEQPKKGAHPDGAEVSALEHLLGDSLTVPADRGLFLSETWRMQPSLTAFTSKNFYEGRLQPRAGLERIGIKAKPLGGLGLWCLPVHHNGNANLAAEEIAAIASLVHQLLEPGGSWTDRHGVERSLGADDLLIVAPYNAQVAALKRALGDLRIGTVDKFQGQEAPIVIVSMTASTIEDAPRGMDFLFSPNRFNVATSRAKCACIVVANPALYEVDCRSPKQMRLANAILRYRELAADVDVTPRTKPGL